MDVYGFIVDEAFFNTSPLMIGSEFDQGIGYLNDDLINYFHVPCTISQNTERQNILANKAKGAVRLLFDSSKYNDMDIFTSMLTEVPDFFTITERIYLEQTKTVEEVDAAFQMNNYTGYVAGSLRVSVKKKVVSIKLEDGTSVDVSIPDFFQFSVLVGETTIRFTIWMNSSAFADNYPLSTITSVVLPVDPKYLLRPSDFLNEINAVIQSSTYSFTELHDSIHSEDHNGVVSYSSRYSISSQENYQMPFAVLYQGKRPEPLMIRAAIRDKLISTGLATEDRWKQLFPDLFITSQFFIVPMWDNFHTTLKGDRFPSVQPLGLVDTKLAEVFHTYSDVWLKDMKELLLNTYIETMLISIPDPLNDGIFSLRDHHPTYQNHPSHSAVFQYQAQHTQEFSLKLAKAMSILMGENTTTSEYMESTVHGRRFLSFASNFVEYHILRREDFDNPVTQE